MSMEDGTLRRLELYLHDLHKKIDGIYDMLMLRQERSGEDKGCSCINEKLLDNQDLCLLFQISPPFPATLPQPGSAPLQAAGTEDLLHGGRREAIYPEQREEFQSGECGALLDSHSSEIQITTVFTIKHLQLWYKRKRVMNRTCW